MLLLPYFCSHYQIIGQDVIACRSIILKQDFEKVDHGKKPAVQFQNLWKRRT